MKQAGAAAMLATMGIPLIGCGEDEQLPEPSVGGDDGLAIDLSTNDFNILQTEDSWVLHPDENILIVNVGGNYRAFTSVCTHSNCSRNWQFEGLVARCTCHGSEFNANGDVIQGPANRSLAEFPVSVDGNILTIG